MRRNNRQNVEEVGNAVAVENEISCGIDWN